MKKLSVILGLSAIALFSCRSAKDIIQFEPNPGGPQFSVVQDSSGNLGICEEFGGSISIDTSKTNEVLRKGLLIKIPNFEGGIWLDENGQIKFFERGCVYLKQ